MYVCVCFSPSSLSAADFRRRPPDFLQQAQRQIDSKEKTFFTALTTFCSLGSFVFRKVLETLQQCENLTVLVV
jgi:hypothetical protein